MVAMVGPSLLLWDWGRSGKEVWSWCHWSWWCFGINFSEPSPKRPILFDLVPFDGYCFASICITSVFWDPKIWNIKPGVATGLNKYEIILQWNSYLLLQSNTGLFWLCDASYIHAFCKFYKSCFIFENECWTDTLSRSRTEEFKQYPFCKQNE